MMRHCPLTGLVTRLPRGLPHARDHPRQLQLARTDASEAEAAQVRTRTPTARATVLRPHLEFRLPLRLLEQRFRRHYLPPFLSSVVLNGMPSSFSNASA